ncbi:unnamed protein product [Symbiodinium natans]|uniref:Uncharacterized protein n=1 Tax=Symbiodinium natans TaxID=878477 RepID=A0A812LEK9_9DINO|nr:unnamed protein product [Symbiodinium natans]
MAQGSQEIFVSSAATKEFGVVLESHNALAQKLVDLQQQLETVKLAHEETLKAAAEKQAKDEERQAAAQKHEEEQNRQAEQLETLKARIDEIGKSHESSDEKLAALEESTATSLKSLQLAIDELGSHQAELKTRILPKWEAELSSQIKKLEKEVLSLRQSGDARTEQLSKASSDLEARVLAECGAVESRLRPQLEEAFRRLNKAEEDLGELPVDLEATAAEGKKRWEALAAELKTSMEELRDFITSQDKQYAAELAEVYGPRMDKLEGALKQADYERLAFADRVTKELASLVKDTEKLSSCDDRHEADSAEIWRELGRRDKEQKESLEKVVKELRTEVISCETRTSDVAQSCSVVVQRQDAGQSDLLRRLEAEVRRLEDRLQAQADSVVHTIRGDEGARIRALEEEVKELARQRQQLAERLDQEERDRKAEVEGAAGGAEKRAAAVELVANARFESVRRALDELVIEFQGYVKTENARSMDVARLEALVRALEVRVWPWRNGAKDRSPSPTHAIPQLPQSKYPEEPDWREWIKKRPATARGRKESMNGLEGSPVGPAITAIRSRPFNDRSDRYA